ncbi:hypothetical protein GOP47_0028803 [Adiantum capillus-veneris]|nr:hypothetical protein GOP47_0028803 [Adiantum capillus-veneris]
MPLSPLRTFSHGFQHSRRLSTVGTAEAKHDELQYLDNLLRKGMHVSRDQIYKLLTRCTSTKDLTHIRRVHTLMISAGLDELGSLGDRLIRLFASSNGFLEADLTFCRIGNLSVHTWQAILSSRSMLGDSVGAFHLYQLMQQENLQPNEFIYSCILKECASTGDLAQGKQVHEHILRQAVVIDVILASVLIDMYAKCGELTVAMDIFHAMPNKNAITCNIMLAGLVENNRNSCAFELFQEIVCQGLELSIATFLCMLKACISVESISEGNIVHDLCVKVGLECDVSIGTALVDMYAKCKNVEDANKVFEALPDKNTVSWNALISGCSQQRREHQAIEHFLRMQEDGVKPDEVTFSSIASSCGNVGAVKEGQGVYDQLIKSGLHMDVVVGNTLVDMYGKWGRLKDAHNVFERLSCKNIVTWNTLLSAYNQHGFNDFVLKLFEGMQRQGLKPDNGTLSCILSACASLKNIILGRTVHKYAIQHGISHAPLVGNSLVDMYSECGSLEDASFVFKGLTERNVVSWNAFIKGKLLGGHILQVWDLFLEMLENEAEPNEVSILHLLKCSGTLGDISKGMLLHVWVLNHELQMDVAMSSMLVDMYMKCRALEEARNIFDSMKFRDVVSWGILITGYAHYDHGSSAVELFCEMQKQGLGLNPILLLSVLKACSNTRDVHFGRMVHEELLARNLELTPSVTNSLVAMYAKCEALEDASAVFKRLSRRDLVTWNAMIAGYAQKGSSECAFDFFKDLLLEDLIPNEVTFSCILNVCASKEYLEHGRLIHSQVCESDYYLDTIVGNTLVNMYCKSGALDDARVILDQVTYKDVVAWNTMLDGYVDQGCASLAIDLYGQMQEKDVRPDKVTFTSLLRACSSSGQLEQGIRVHEELVGSGIALDSVIGNSLVDMYIKCGSVRMAMAVFANLHARDTVSFNTIISGCVQHEQAFSALQCFEEMQRDGIEPDEVTFLFTIKASGSIGAVRYGRWMHDQVLRQGLDSNQTLGNTLISMYFMCGSLAEATKSFLTLPNQSVVSWSALISGYSEHGSFLQARQCLKQMQGWGFKPVDMTFTSMLAACSQEGKLEEGNDLFESMKEHFGIQPSLEHYNCMLQLLGCAGHLKEAEYVLKTMPLAADICSWTTLLIACRSFGEVQLGRKCNGRMHEIIVADPSLELVTPKHDSDFLQDDSLGSV